MHQSRQIEAMKVWFSSGTGHVEYFGQLSNLFWTGPARDGAMIGTTDGGSHWYKQLSDTPDAIAHIQFVNPQTGWAASQNGFILKYEPPK